MEDAREALADQAAFDPVQRRIQVKNPLPAAAPENMLQRSPLLENVWMHGNRLTPSFLPANSPPGQILWYDW